MNCQHMGTGICALAVCALKRFWLQVKLQCLAYFDGCVFVRQVLVRMENKARDLVWALCSSVMGML